MKRNLLAVSGLLLTVGLIIAIVIPLHSQELSQNSNTGAAELSELAPKSRPEIQPIRTDSPRETLSTFRRLRNDLDKELANWPRRSRAASDRGKLISDQLVALIDMENPLSHSGHSTHRAIALSIASPDRQTCARRSLGPCSFAAS